MTETLPPHADRRRTFEYVLLSLIFTTLLPAGAASQSLPPGWAVADVGAPAVPGYATYSNQRYVVSGAGTGIDGTADQFTFAYRVLTGDGTIVAQLGALPSSPDSVQAGLMIRQGLGAAAMHATLVASRSDGITFRRRKSAGGTTAITAAAGHTAPLWLKLDRRSTTLKASYSTDGVTWTLLSSDTVNMYNVMYVGLAVSSRIDVAAAQGTFTGVQVSSLIDYGRPLPTGWSSQDLGGPGQPGAAVYDAGTFGLVGGGADIGGTWDQFRFAYAQRSADVEIVARVRDLGNTNTLSRAGVMLRDSLTANGAHASMFVASSGAITFRRRPSAGQATVDTAGAARKAPVWLKLLLRNGVVKGFRSVDGKTWTLVGTESLTLPSPFYVGLAVTSRNNAATVVTNIDQVRVGAAPANANPTVSLTAPAGGSTYAAPATIVVSANAKDTDGRIARTDFYQGSTLIGTDTTSPYSITWSNVPAGTYSLTAVATDDDGGVVTSLARTVTVSGPANQAPAVGLTAPASGATYTAPATITISATATDSDGTIARVEFLQGTTLIGSDTTSPYSIAWSNVQPGTYSLTARATDNGGATTTSAARTVTVNGLPSGWTAADIGNPAIAGSTTYNNGTYTIRAGGADVWDVADQFHYVYRNATGDFDVIARVTSVEQAHEWSKAGIMIRATLAANAANASMFVSANGMTAYQRRTSAGTITTTTNVPGPAPRWLKLARRGSTITGSSSTDGVTWTTVDTQVMTLPASFYVGVAVSSVNATTAITAAVANVSLNAVAPNEPPTVALTAPANGATYTAPATITITASGSDTDGTIARVDFYRGTTIIASDTTSPYSVTWSNVPAGTYSLTARATDDDGGTTTSAARTVTVNSTSNQPPAVALTAPANGATFTAPATITVSATASDTDGTIARVEFYQGTTVIGSDTTSPYSITWSNVPAGSYSLTARATDNAGATTTSAARTATVNAAGSQRNAVFRASPDHNALVSSYLLEIFAAGANPATATPIATRNLGKPAVVNGDCTVDVTTTINALAPGNYQATVAAVGSGGSSRSAPSTFTR